jgi:murein DD-endopeptidase MepM/ murein hydrolase activator NlpD
MRPGRTERLARAAGAALLLALVCQACTQPARVVLYDQRQQANRGVRDVQAPVPRAKPTTSQERRAPVARAVPSTGGTVETAPLPPAGKAAGSEPVTAARSYDRVAEASSSYRGAPEGGVHVVAPKETVYALSRLYGVPVRSLLVLNKLDPPYLLHTGQKIAIPVQRTHVVAQGETVYSISRRYDVSIAELVRLNDVPKPFVIVTGQTLLLPDAQRTAVATAEPGERGETEDQGDARVADEPPPPAAGDVRPPFSEDGRATERAPAAKRVVLPPSTNIPHPSELSGDGFLWPLDGTVISAFGPKGKGLTNDGINIAAPRGTPIVAAQNGVVAYRGNELRGFGNLILIKHDKGYMTAYAHASQILVERGARVKRGQVIAKVGNTGSVADPQLHFEIRRGRKPVDPMRHLNRTRAAMIEAATKG